MEVLPRTILEYYKYINEDLADPRTREWPLMWSPWRTMAIIAFYMYFSLDAGPKFMSNRPPFNVDRLVVAYDAFQIVVCGWLTAQGLMHIFPFRFRFFCEPVDYSNEEHALFVAKLVWIYFMLKLLDLLDTVFFVLRKKNSQITFLHVYHHAGMCVGGYIGTKYVAGGHFVLIGHVNSFVHSVMYTYYLLANVNPEYKKSIWWKKHITQLQIAQFLLLLVQNFPTLFWEHCGVNFPLRLCLSLQISFILALFLDFYRKAYGSDKASGEHAS